MTGAAYEVALTPLPFPGWSLATVIPEAEFLARSKPRCGA